MANPQGLLSPLERQTYESFGIAPREDRLSLLPRYSAKTGIVAPQFVYDAAKALAAPYTAAQGYELPPQEAVNVGMNMMGGGSVGTAPKGALRTFIGRNAKTWDKAAESKFLELEKKGVSPEDIWKQTGTFRSPDNQLRQEISDANLQITDYRNTGGGVSIKHPELQAAYEQIPRGIKVTPSSRMEGMAAYEAPKDPLYWKLGEGGTLHIPSGDAVPRDVYAHELQHAIQAKEGFARGGSPQSMVLTLEKLAEDKRREARKFFDLSTNNDPLGSKIIKPGARKKGLELEKEARQLEDQALAAYRSEQTKFDLYQKLAGEAEARAVEKRLNMTPEERAQVFPLKSYDVPKEKLIIKGLLQ